jgi:hypothetical protein
VRSDQEIGGPSRTDTFGGLGAFSGGLPGLGGLDTLRGIVDEILIVAIVLFLVASFCSYTSMRSLTKGEYHERIAEIIFLGGLSLLACIAVAVGVEILQ